MVDPTTSLTSSVRSEGLFVALGLLSPVVGEAESLLNIGTENGAPVFLVIPSSELLFSVLNDIKLAILTRPD